jgi:hypothetical protein
MRLAVVARTDRLGGGLAFATKRAQACHETLAMP